jgi:hypothetical protein
MKTSFKLIFMDRAILVLSSILILALLFTIASSIYVRKIEGENEILKNRLDEIQALAGNVIEIKSFVESKEKKIGLRKNGGVISTLEQALKNIGLTAKKIKPLNKKKVDVFTEDNAELEIEDTDLNSIVNLLYRIENSRVPLKIKAAAIKTTFENPDKFILKLTVSLLSKNKG